MANKYANYHYQILGENDNDESVRLKADTLTESLKVISTDHSNNHQGKIFSISGIYSNIADSASVNYAFKTPTVASGKIIHLKYVDFVSSSNKVRMDLYEAPTNDPTAGTDISAYNHNRLGTPTATSMQAIKNNTTFDGTGVTMLNWQYVTNNIQPTDYEWILKPNTWYVRLFTNLSGGAVDLSFYEVWSEE